MNNDLQKKRMFLFLQGPHGPFFSQLACALESYGHATSQIGFNQGDKIFWANKRNFIAFTLPIHAWSGFLQREFRDKRITDLVIYNDTRPFHKTAIQAAHAKGINVHIFEEGYLRPYWVTYERDGSNGNSKLMSLAQSAVVPDHLIRDPDPVPAPCHWGDMREHIFYGAVYHWCILCANRQFPNFTSHREISIRKEFRLHLKQLVFTPARIAARFWANLTLKCRTFPYHLILMQLQHDSAFQNHSPFKTNASFLELTLRSFANNAPPHHHLVIKAHPLEDGRSEIAYHLRRLGTKFGINRRIHYLPGGKLAHVLDPALSVVTVNSTAGQQALWRGIPVKTLGQAIYNHDKFISKQSLDAFFAHPKAPNLQAYKAFRNFLLQTSQIPGGFYSKAGRQQAIAQLAKKMFHPLDPYSAYLTDQPRHKNPDGFTLSTAHAPALVAAE
ncbi:MAG: capsule biosynthesis protein [Paracoccaceae bacterium]